MIENPTAQSTALTRPVMNGTADRADLDASLSWARPGIRRRRLPRRQGPQARELIRGALVASGLAATAWLATLVVVAVAEGRSAAYPFAAVTALFRGERALGLPPVTGQVTTSVLVRGVLWTAVIAVLLGAVFAVVSLRALPRRRTVVAVSAALAALAVFLLGVALVGQPGGRTLQREVSSYQGFRDLGLPLVALAQVLAGATFGAYWARLTCRQTVPLDTDLTSIRTVTVMPGGDAHSQEREARMTLREIANPSTERSAEHALPLVVLVVRTTTRCTKPGSRPRSRTCSLCVPSRSWSTSRTARSSTPG